MTTSTFFIEILSGKKLTAEAQIINFIQGNYPQEHIQACENRWKRLGYRDERAWPHLFPLTLNDLCNKWYKIEEAQGDTFNWKTVKENFIKDFLFETYQEKLKETTKIIKDFIQD